MLCQFCVTFCATEKKQVKRSEQSIYFEQNMTIFDLFGLFFEFVWAYLIYMEDMKNKDTIYWGIP